MLIKATADELRKALKDIEAAEANGFMFCEAVFDAESVDNCGNLSLCYSDMIEKAHPTDPSLDWGRFQRVSARNRFDGKKLIPQAG